MKLISNVVLSCVTTLGGLMLLPSVAAAVDFKIDLPPEAGKRFADSSEKISPTQSVSAEVDPWLVEDLKQAEQNLMNPTEENLEDAPMGGAIEADPWIAEERSSKATGSGKSAMPPSSASSSPVGDPLLPLDLPPMPTAILPRTGSHSPQIGSVGRPPQVGSLRRSKAGVGSLNALSTSSEEQFPTPACLVDNVSFWERIYSELEVNDALLHDRESMGIVYGVIKLPPSGNPDREAIQRQFRTYYQEKLERLASAFDAPATWDKDMRELARLFPAKTLSAERLRRASENLRVQTGLKSRFEAGVQRSLKHIPLIHKIVIDSGLPTDIINLPHVESSYMNVARSKVGAAGLWQIMPGTMKLLMGQGSVNLRTQVEPSTIAAVKLLKQNFEATKSWPLALTAYNHGLNGVLRAVKQTGSRDLCEIIDRYSSRSFRFASSNFYAQFLAARNVALERYSEISKQRGAAGKILLPVLATISKGPS